MNSGIVKVSIAAIRSQASHQSEMTSQLLYGEHFTTLSRNDEWLFISCSHDEHEGWIHNNQIIFISDTVFKKQTKHPPTYAFDLVSPAISNHEHIPIILGSTLPNFDGLSFQFNDKKIIYNGQVLTPDQKNPELTFIEKIAYKYLNAPYLWGGRSPFGIDTGGFVQMAYQLCGISLPRTIEEQCNRGKSLHLLGEAKRGDLVFFHTDHHITHAGILLDQNRVIHCDEKVKINAIDNHGIYNQEQNRYSHQLRIIKRIG